MPKRLKLNESSTKTKIRTRKRTRWRSSSSRRGRGKKSYILHSLRFGRSLYIYIFNHLLHTHSILEKCLFYKILSWSDFECALRAKRGSHSTIWSHLKEIAFKRIVASPERWRWEFHAVALSMTPMTFKVFYRCCPTLPRRHHTHSLTLWYTYDDFITIFMLSRTGHSMNHVHGDGIIFYPSGHLFVAIKLKYAIVAHRSSCRSYRTTFEMPFARSK